MTVHRDKPAAPADEATGIPAPSSGDGRSQGTSNRDRRDDDEDPWRHPPVAPVDESPLESLGRSMSDVVIGPAGDTKDDKPKP
jgi:hypothetical protein